MKTYLLIFGLLLSACTATEPTPELNHLSLMSPKGAPAFALIPMLQDEVDAIEFVDGVDVLSAELLKGELDVILAPINLGAQLAQRGDFPYRLYAVITWGNLFVVKSEQATQSATIGIFGQQAVPGIVWQDVATRQGIQLETSAFASVAEVSAQLLAGQLDRGLLAEPSLSLTLQKAQQAGLNLTIEYDVQALWKASHGVDNYPQAGLFIRDDLTEAQRCFVFERFQEMQAFVEGLDGNVQSLDQKIDGVDLTSIGLPPAPILQAAFYRMHVQPRLAVDELIAIELFLERFDLAHLENFYSDDILQK